MSMMRAAALALCLFVVGCSSQAPRVAATPSPRGSQAAPPSLATSASASPQEGPYGIFVKGFVDLQSPNPPPRYSISLVDLAGKVVTQAEAANRRNGCHPLVPLPNVSASGSHVYFLDGDSIVKSLAPNGAVATVMDLGVGSSQQAVFAVSPDDRRIAVSLLDNLNYPVRTQLYVEDVGTGGNRADLFSGIVLEWPIGWHQGSLVLAVGINAHPQDCRDTFSYSTLGYNVANAATGDRLRTTCDQRTSYYPPVPAGSVCPNNSAIGDRSTLVESWDGDSRTLSNVGGCPQNGALSTDGMWVASKLGAAPGGGCTGQNNIYLLGRDDKVSQTNAHGAPEGWIDPAHLVVMAEPISSSATRSILDVRSNSVTELGGVGFFGGSLPGGLG
jgi:hypothetical protein